MVFLTRTAACAALALAAAGCSLRGLGEEYGVGGSGASKCGAPLPSYVDLSLFREAEDAVVLDPSTPFAISDDAAAHGCKYIGMGACVERAPMARFAFTVAAAGDYHIYVRSRARDTNSNSFYVKVDDQPVNGFQYVVSRPGSFIEEQMMETRDDNTPVEISFQLSQGGHAVDMLCRKQDAALDWMALVPAQ